MTGTVPSTGYLLAGLGVMFLVTVALRAAPFLALTRLRFAGRPVPRRTMPAGVMGCWWSTCCATPPPHSPVVAGRRGVAVTGAPGVPAAAISIVLGTATFMAQAWLG